MSLFNRFVTNNLYVAAFFALIALACARQSSPMGGPKDDTPPVPLKSKPVNYSTNFTGDRFLIQFNEFVVLKNIRQELLVSPPLPEKPDVKLRGKNVIVKINNLLKDSTTYNFNFYGALSDLTENNPLPNFQFEFSTGPVFDSIYLGGTLRDAFNYKTETGIYVMLYETLVDSVPRKTLPAYIAKTDENGTFMVTNLKNKPYRIFALKDQNNNLKFDLPTEAVAFTDSAYMPGFVEKEFVDTLHLISSISPDRKDTVYMDSVVHRKNMVTTIGNIQLFLFAEDFGFQYFKNLYRLERQQVVLAFNKPVDSSFHIRPLIDSTVAEPWFVQEKTPKNDSLVFWITDTALFHRDSLKLQIQYTMKDSNLVDYIKTDTLLAFFETKEVENEKPKETKKEGRFGLNLFNQKEKNQKVDSGPKPSELTFSCNAKAPFELNKPVELVARFPLKSVNTQNIQLIKIVDDTIKKPIKFKLFQDSLQTRKYLIDFVKEEEEKYELLIPSGAFIDLFGNANDTLKYAFTTRGLDYYSNLTLHLTKVGFPSVMQLMDEKETVQQEWFIQGDTSLTIPYLAPKKYLLKLFNDTNPNKKWDTGNFLLLQHPEQVYYFPKEVETKSNWDLEFDWEMATVTPPHLKKDKKGKTTDPKNKNKGTPPSKNN